MHMMRDGDIKEDFTLMRLEMERFNFEEDNFKINTFLPVVEFLKFKNF